MTSSHGKTQTPAKRTANQKQNLQRKREVAKWGMVATMGALVATGYFRSRTARKAHIVAGVALLGFTYWHQVLYSPNGKRAKSRNA